jgi:hypothetical protein
VPLLNQHLVTLKGEHMDAAVKEPLLVDSLAGLPAEKAVFLIDDGNSSHNEPQEIG